MAGKKNVLSSLAVYAEDSEPESDGEAGVDAVGGAAEEKSGLVSDAYGEDDFSRLGGDEDGYEEEEDENSKQSEDDDSETEKPEADDPKDNTEAEKRDPQELVALQLLTAAGLAWNSADAAWGAGSKTGKKKEIKIRLEYLPELGSAPPEGQSGDGRKVQCNDKIPSASSTASFSERVRNMSPDEIKIPPEPPGRCSNHLQLSSKPMASPERMND
ncbi:hypothetical protein A6R68_08694 [Neotoma lepida]|uniref:Uncharacterized protein n=1 Tax=Neotoma lepida TaxID=56216 RepID=A0A1A6G1V0_NEOLE|nr:hypothetical protein A6R68_08694 [Neotoma lepida]